MALTRRGPMLDVPLREIVHRRAFLSDANDGRKVLKACIGHAIELHVAGDCSWPSHPLSFSLFIDLIHLFDPILFAECSIAICRTLNN